jgi:Transposase
MPLSVSIRMPPGSTVGRRNTSSPCHRTGDPTAVRSFPTFTADLYRLADWLTACRVTHVVMEATGVYWIPIFEILDARGFQVILVNARHVKRQPRDLHSSQPRAASGGLHQRPAAGGLRRLTTDRGIRASPYPSY